MKLKMYYYSVNIDSSSYHRIGIWGINKKQADEIMWYGIDNGFIKDFKFERVRYHLYKKDKEMLKLHSIEEIISHNIEIWDNYGNERCKHE